MYLTFVCFNCIFMTSARLPDFSLAVANQEAWITGGPVQVEPWNESDSPRTLSFQRGDINDTFVI